MMTAGSFKSRIFLLAISGLLFWAPGSQNQALAQAPDSESLIAAEWAETGMSFEFLINHLADKDCYQNLQHFVGCVNAVNWVLGSKDNPQELNWNQGPQFEIIPVVVHNVNSSTEGLNPLQEMRRLMNLNLQEWTNAYETTRSPRRAHVDFAALLRSAQTAIPADQQAMVAGNAYSQFQINAVDPHTSYSPTATRMRRAQANGYVLRGGVGVSFRIVDNRALIVYIRPDGPADRAGIRVRDIITAVNGRPFTGTLRSQAVYDRLLGEANTTVELQLQRGSRNIRRTVNRQSMTVPNAQGFAFNTPNGKIGLIALQNFSGDSTCQDFANTYQTLLDQSILGLIVDLRSNPGGRIDFVSCMLASFVGPHRNIMTYRNVETGHILVGETVSTPEPLIHIDIPTVVLVDSDSASASEIFAGVLQDYNLGLVVGERTFGKGTVQNVGPAVAFPGLDYRHTIARFHLPSGRSNQLVGIEPDITAYAIPDPTETYMLASREGDLFYFPIASGGGSRPPLTARLQAARSCASNLTWARANYSSTTLDALAAYDFQVLAGMEAVNCLRTNP